MRDLKQLIPIVINHIEQDNDFHGLCLTLIVLESDKTITVDERLCLKRFFRHQAIIRDVYATFFWWQKYEKQPRIEFLNELLKNLKN